MIPTHFNSMHRQVLLLATAQALFQTASTLVMTVGALAGSHIAHASYLATAPIASMLFGTVLATAPASMWMARVGRRTGFVAGSFLGVCGGLIAAWGIHAGSLLVMSLGTLLIGCNQAFAQFYRFAASEVSDAAFRARAISFVLAGGVVAAVLGPALGTWGEPLLERSYVGSFLILSIISLIATGLLTGLRVPMLDAESGASKPRPLRAIMAQPSYAVALFGAASGAGMMVLAMTATPLAMVRHEHALPATAAVIQAHVLGMFLPSFFTGSLIARFGVIRIMFAGAALLFGHVVLSLSGFSFGSFASALVLLGIGWNFLYIGGTTLLTNAYEHGERARAQGANDLVIYVVGLMSALSAGALLQAVGWRWMNILMLPWLAALVIAISWLGYRQRRQQ